MSVRLRLQRKGTKKRPFYRIVVADQRAARDGRYIEQLGIYDPLQKPAVVDLNVEKAEEWIGKGAQPTDTVRIIIRKFKAGETQTKQELESRNRQARKDRREAAAKGLGAPPKAAPVEEEPKETKAAAEAPKDDEDKKDAAATDAAATDAAATDAAATDAAAAEPAEESSDADTDEAEAKEPKQDSSDAASESTDDDGDDA